MASSVKVENHLPQFKMSLFNVMDDALAETALDILILSRQKAPVKQGYLRSASLTNQVAKMRHVVSYYAEYAGAQEAGMAGGRVFRNYTTAGTGAHYLENTGDEKSAMMTMTFAKHARRAKV